MMKLKVDGNKTWALGALLAAWGLGADMIPESWATIPIPSDGVQLAIVAGLFLTLRHSVGKLSEQVSGTAS